MGANVGLLYPLLCNPSPEVSIPIVTTSFKIKNYFIPWSGFGKELTNI